jgi:hypothetical protein
MLTSAVTLHASRTQHGQLILPVDLCWHASFGYVSLKKGHKYGGVLRVPELTEH